ncbi:MAG: hypothetical protein HQM02_02585 [Magnetococcales bacterium]|nr:hypothetical protein [Magnetococcales bacterium]
MTQNDGVEVIEVTDRIEAPQPPAAAPSPAREAGTPASRPQTDTVPIEDLVTVFVDSMTNLVAHLIQTGQKVARVAVKKIRALSNP